MRLRRFFWMSLVPIVLAATAPVAPAGADTGSAPSAEKPPATAPPSAPAPTAAPAATAAAVVAPAGKAIAARPLVLPGSGPDGVMMDYLVFDAATKSVWVPAGNTGSVDVIEAGSGKIARIEGFPTAEVERRGRKRTVGPSSASAGPGVVFVGNRANSTVCSVDVRTRKPGACATLASMPDGVAYVASTKEIWVTTPRDQTLTILDASNPAAPSVKTTVKLEGDPEGYFVDDAHGVFYTNLEDKDRTLAIDIKSRKVKASWSPGCGEEGPRGLAFDSATGLLFVACTDHVVVLDTGHDGAIRSKLPTGAGVDNIAYLPSKRLLFVAAGQAATLTIAHVGDEGALVAVASGMTAEGARVVVVDGAGGAYVADSRGGRILYFSPQ